MTSGQLSMGWLRDLGFLHLVAFLSLCPQSPKLSWIFCTSLIDKGRDNVEDHIGVLDGPGLKMECTFVQHSMGQNLVICLHVFARNSGKYSYAVCLETHFQALNIHSLADYFPSLFEEWFSIGISPYHVSPHVILILRFSSHVISL